MRTMIVPLTVDYHRSVADLYMHDPFAGLRATDVLFLEGLCRRNIIKPNLALVNFGKKITTRIAYRMIEEHEDLKSVGSFYDLLSVVRGSHFFDIDFDDEVSIVSISIEGLTDTELFLRHIPVLTYSFSVSPANAGNCMAGHYELFFPPKGRSHVWTKDWWFLALLKKEEQ